MCAQSWEHQRRFLPRCPGSCLHLEHSGPSPWPCSSDTPSSSEGRKPSLRRERNWPERQAAPVTQKSLDADHTQLLTLGPDFPQSHSNHPAGAERVPMPLHSVLQVNSLLLPQFIIKLECKGFHMIHRRQ